MNRRNALRQLIALIAAAGAPLPLAAEARVEPLHGGRYRPLAACWAAWKAAFLAEDGRVVDAMQQGASHSESQGYGLLLAALFEDDAAFDLIFGWTEENLAIRADALLAWRWLPETGGDRVPDRNNASDGDLFYAWALVLRGSRDGDGAMIARAQAIAAALVAACVVPAPDGSGRLLLKPAAQGFERGGKVVVNPSYYMPLAMREVAGATGVGQLATCAADGLAMMADLAASGLIPDWVEVGKSGMAPPSDRPDHNGYEAMRVPLFLIWSGSAGHPAVQAEARAYRRAAALAYAAPAAALSDADAPVTVFDRKSGAVVERSGAAGYAALAALADCAVGTAEGSAIPVYRTLDQPYYPATLHLMALIAQITAAPNCVPI